MPAICDIMCYHFRLPRKGRGKGLEINIIAAFTAIISYLLFKYKAVNLRYIQFMGCFMSVFIAIQFSEAVKDGLMDTVSRLKECSGGNFTRRENLHLTLAFLGEVRSPLGAIRAMEVVSATPFELILERLGMFHRDGGSIVWEGVRITATLTALHKQLTDNLAAEGFIPEIRPFRPHLTLVREADVDSDNLDVLSKNTPRLKSTVTCISLMKSELIRGILTYKEIYRKDF